MRVNHRLRKLETRFERVVDAVSPIWSDPEWYDLFAEKGREGFFRREPDFPRALDDYGRAIAAAERIAPEIDPPRDFRIHHPRRIPRLFTWRNDPRFPAVGAGFEWLAALLVRVLDRMPPVTEAAFAELACWFHEHEPRLRERCPATGQLDPGDGDAIRLSDLTFDLKAGPRRVESGRVAESVRRLRAAFEGGTLVEPPSAPRPAWPPGTIVHPDGDGMTIVLDRNL
jgi:hypothetical protein